MPYLVFCRIVRSALFHLSTCGRRASLATTNCLLYIDSSSFKAVAAVALRITSTIVTIAAITTITKPSTPSQRPKEAWTRWRRF